MDNMRQHVFDVVVRHLLTQRKKAMDESNSVCLYKAPDGTRCAIGCLIDDRFYTSGIEGASVRDEIVHSAVCRSLGISVETYKEENLYLLLAGLRRIHDHRPVSLWHGDLHTYAIKHNFQWTFDSVIQEQAAEFQKEFKALVRKYVPEYSDEAGEDTDRKLLISMMQARASVYSPFVWSDDDDNK